MTHENEQKFKFALQGRAWSINYETYTDNFLWVNNPIVVFPFVHSKSTCRKYAVIVNTLNKVSKGKNSIEDIIFVGSR